MKNAQRMFLLAVVALLAGAWPAPAREPPAEAVVVTRIEGQLADSMVAMLRRAIGRAEDEGARLLIVEIDTLGGAITVMDQIAHTIETSSVKPVAYVTHEAVSAGAFIALACEQIFTNERAQIGSSLPVAVSPFGTPLPKDVFGEELLEKEKSYLRSKFRDRAQSHDRPGMAALAEAMVDPDVEVLLVQRGRDRLPMTREEYDDLVRSQGRQAASIIETICQRGELLNLTAQEAFDYGFSDGIVVSREEILDTEGLTGARIIEIGPTWSEQLVGFLQGVKVYVAGFGLLLIVLEIFFFPGTFAALAIGVLLLALVFFRNYLVGLADVPEILLVVLGVVLIAIEIFVIPGFGVAGVAGITCVALGVLFSFLPFLVPDGPFEVNLLTETIRDFSLSLVVSLLVLYVISRKVLPKTPFFGRMILDTGVSPATLQGSAASLSLEDGEAMVKVGDHGTAASTLRPSGKVEVDGKVLDALSQGDYISQGARIVVVRVEANHVVVRTATETGEFEGTA